MNAAALGNVGAIIALKQIDKHEGNTTSSFTPISDEANQGSKQGEHIPQMVDPIPRVRYIDPLELREELSSEPNYDLPPGLVDDPSTDPNSGSGRGRGRRRCLH